MNLPLVMTQRSYLFIIPAAHAASEGLPIRRMRRDVSTQARPIRVRFSTFRHSTNERSGSRVNPHVTLIVGRRRKSFAALETYVRLFARVQPRVYGALSVGFETEIAAFEAARVGPFAGVRAFMAGEIRRGFERFRAILKGADERTFVGVSAQMNRHSARVFSHVTAKRAFVNGRG